MKYKHYSGNFAKWSDVHDNYGGKCPASEPRFVFAEYETGNYEGSSTVITSRNGRTFSVVEGSHCSCYGLEGQWEPTEHTVTEIRKMMGASYGFFADASGELKKWLAHVRQS